jgi:hypothetical protein
MLLIATAREHLPADLSEGTNGMQLLSYPYPYPYP